MLLQGKAGFPITGRCRAQATLPAPLVSETPEGGTKQPRTCTYHHPAAAVAELPTFVFCNEPQTAPLQESCNYVKSQIYI